jgi:hypothetical protein
VISDTASDADLDTGETLTKTVTCSGATPNRIGGGVALNDDTSPVVTDSFPSGGTTPGTSWTGTASTFTNNQANVTLTVYAICAP